MHSGKPKPSFFTGLDPRLTRDVVILEPACANENFLKTTFQEKGSLLEILDMSGVLPKMPSPQLKKREALPASAAALHEAIQRKNQGEVTRLIASGAPIHLKDDKGFSALDYANFVSMDSPDIFDWVQRAALEEKPIEEKRIEEKTIEITQSPSFREKIKQCQAILARPENKYDKSDPRHICSMQNAILKELKQLPHSAHNIETHAAIVSLLRMTVLAPDAESLQASLREFFRIREKLLLGQPEDYCFQVSPLNQLCLNLAKAVFPSEAPLNVLYHTTLTEDRRSPWNDYTESTDRLPGVEGFYRSSRGTIELYEGIVRQAIRALNDGDRSLENIWRGTDGAENNKFETVYYTLLRSDFLILSQRSPALKQLIDYSNDVARFVAPGDVYGKFNHLRECLKQNSISGSGQHSAASEAIYPKLREFTDWWNQLGSTEHGKKIQNDILAIRGMRDVLDNLFITKEKEKLESKDPGRCIQLTGTDLEGAIERGTETLKKLSESKLHIKTKNELDQLDKQILEELKNPFPENGQTGQNSYQHALKRLEEIPEIIQDPAFSYTALESLIPALGQLTLFSNHQQATPFDVRRKDLIDDSHFGGIAKYRGNGNWYPVEITSQDQETVNIRYLDDNTSGTKPINDYSHFIPASVLFSDNKTQIRMRLIENLLQNGADASPLYYYQMFTKSGSFSITENILLGFIKSGANLDFLRSVKNAAINEPALQRKIISLALAKKDGRSFSTISELFPERITDEDRIQFLEFCTDIPLTQKALGERARSEWIIQQMRLAINRNHFVLFDSLYQLTPVAQDIEIRRGSTKSKKILSLLSSIPELAQDPAFSYPALKSLIPALEQLTFTPNYPSIRAQAIQLGVAEEHLHHIENLRFGGFVQNLSRWYPVEIMSQNQETVHVRYPHYSSTGIINIHAPNRFIPVSLFPVEEIKLGLIQNLLRHGDNQSALHYCRMLIKSESLTEKKLLGFVKNGANLDFLHAVAEEKAIDHPEFQKSMISLALAEKDSLLFSRISAFFPDTIADKDLTQFLQFCIEIPLIQKVLGERAENEKWIIGQMRLAINKNDPVLFDNLYQLALVAPGINIPQNKIQRKKMLSVLSSTPELVEDPAFGYEVLKSLVLILRQLKPTPDRESATVEAARLGLHVSYLIDHPDFAGFLMRDTNEWHPVAIIHEDEEKVDACSLYLSDQRTESIGINGLNRLWRASTSFSNNKAEIKIGLIQNLLGNLRDQSTLHYCPMFIKSMTEIIDHFITLKYNEPCMFVPFKYNQTYIKVVKAITATDPLETRAGWADLYNAIAEMLEYSKEIEEEAPEAAQDFRNFSLLLLQKANTYHMTPEKDRDYSAFERDLKQRIEEKIPDFKHRHFACFKAFGVFLANVLLALTGIGAIYMIVKKTPLVQMPTTREKKTQAVIAATQKISAALLLFKPKREPPDEAKHSPTRVSDAESKAGNANVHVHVHVHDFP